MLPNQPMQHTKPGRSDIEPTFKKEFQCWNNPAASTGYCKWWVNYEMP
jgi:hypothetical protein